MDTPPDLYVRAPFAPTVAADGATLRLGLVPGAVTLLVYLLSLPRDITGDHAGEWVTAAVVGGVPHAPGYPLWTLLAATLNSVLPVVTAVWRVALLSALSTAAAAGLMTVWLSQQGLGRRASVFGGLLMGLGAATWQQAVTPGPEPLALLLMLGAWVSLYQWIATARGVYLPVTVLLMASGVIQHPGFVAVVLPAAAVIVLRRPALRLGTGVWLGMALALLVALAPIAYLPLRAQARPFVNAGHPATLSRVVDQYVLALGGGHGESTGESVDPMGQPGASRPGHPTVAARLGAVVAGLVREHVGIGLVLAVFGLWVTARRARGDGWLLGALLVLPGVAAVLLPAAPAGAPSACPVTSLVLVHAVVALLAARAVDAALQRTGIREAWRSRTVSALAALLPTLLLAVNFGRGDHSDYSYARDYVRSTLTQLPDDAVLFTGGRLETYAFLYHQGVLAERLDVIVVDRCAELDWQRIPSLALAPDQERTASDAILELLETGRPVFATWPLPVAFPPGVGWGEVGLLYRAAGIGDPRLAEEHHLAWDGIDFERLPASAGQAADLGAVGAPLDATARHIAAIYYGALARRLSAARKPEWNRASVLARELREP